MQVTAAHRCRWRGLVWTLLFILVTTARDSGASSLDFIYVNSNVGESAGGHTALRIDQRLFHYQFFPDERFLLVRERWPHFRHLYNELRNRSISLARLPLPAPTLARIQTTFTRQLIEQQRDQQREDDLVFQRDLLHALKAGGQSVVLPIVGLFGERQQTTAGRELRRLLADSCGDQIEVDLRRVNAQLSRLLGAAVGAGALAEAKWGKSVKQALLWRQALRILCAAQGVAEDALIGPLPEERALSEEECQILARYRQSLLASIVGLLQSPRPDKGEPLLLQIARYHVVSRSLAEGRLLTLDPFSNAALSVEIPPDQHTELSRLLAGPMSTGVQRARDLFLAEQNHRDIAYTLLESRRGRSAELHRAMTAGVPLRSEPGQLLPARGGSVPLGTVASVSEDVYHQADLVLNNYSATLQERYGYHLTRRNCATQLLVTLNDTFADPVVGQRALGGWLPPDEALSFIPDRFYANVTATYPVTTEEHFPSRRLRELAALRKRDSSFTTLLQESSPLTSSLYSWRPEDTPFLFFTDDTLWSRPLLGTANVLYGAGYSAYGVLTLPFDEGEGLHHGLRGIFYSLPELFFVNIRKGTYATLPVTASPAQP